MFNLRLVNLNWFYLYISNPVHGNLLHVSSIIEILPWKFIRAWKTKVSQAFHKLNKIWESTMADSMERNLYVAPVIPPA